ncbi:hypothetical protein BSM4216_3129 [Bacillus smithii]|nr:hypothetical protein BSM4216_3129 [Bacillus smithii]
MRIIGIWLLHLVPSFFPLSLSFSSKIMQIGAFFEYIFKNRK